MKDYVARINQNPVALAGAFGSHALDADFTQLRLHEIGDGGDLPRGTARAMIR